MEKNKKLKKAENELNKTMVDLLKGMTEDLKQPKENFELKYLQQRVLVLETKLDMLMQIFLK